MALHFAEVSIFRKSVIVDFSKGVALLFTFCTFYALVIKGMTPDAKGFDIFAYKLKLEFEHNLLKWQKDYIFNIKIYNTAEKHCL